MAQINPYIHFNGNTEEAFTFYKSVFGGTFGTITRFKDIDFPPNLISENEMNKIMRITLPIGKHTMLIGSDVPKFLGQVNENENRSKIVVNTQTKEEADTIFEKLSAGGQIEVPMADASWGVYFGMFRDKFGIEWLIEFQS
ncbi:VOC family protein [Flavobacterium croceum]|uniref:VOC family protein n=1 Tax=Flavobacterium croceum TaxID=370975 RepID=UPI0024A967FF|nr:VOC family protein [Flavobacterium croceum]